MHIFSPMVVAGLRSGLIDRGQCESTPKAGTTLPGCFTPRGFGHRERVAVYRPHKGRMEQGPE